MSDPPAKPRSGGMPAPVVALATWLVPGSGYILLGQRARGLTIGLTILALFTLGLYIGGARVVDEPDWRSASFRDALMNKPWFVTQVLNGPVAFVTSRLSHTSQFAISHSRINEIGTLYTAVAGMLNLLAIIDSTYRAARGEGAP